MRAPAVATLLASLLAAPSALADGQRVALVSSDRELRAAARVALSPWAVEVLPLDPPQPGATMPMAAAEAEQVAIRHHADVVAWISEVGGQRALWVFDAELRATRARPLAPRPPFDPETAAGVALTLKTLLRTTLVAPLAERFGSAPPPPAAQEPPPRATEAPRPLAANAPVVARRPLRLEVTPGIHVAPTDAAAVEPRLAVGAALWPDARLGGGVAVSFGAGSPVREPRLSARHTDVTVGASLRLRVPLGGKVALEPALGTAAHLTALEGTADGSPSGAPGDREAVRATAFDVSVDAGAVLEVRATGGLHVGLAVSGSYLTRHQRFLVRGEPVLEVAPLFATVGLRLGVEVP